MPTTPQGAMVLLPAVGPPNASPFSRAINDYIQSRSEKSSTPQFLKGLESRGSLITKDDIQAAIVELEQSNTNKASTRHVRTILRPIIRVLSDYTGVLEALASADPMPSCIVWGCLKAVVEASKRFLRLYDVIKDQLDALQNHLDRLTAYEELFGESDVLQKLLEHSYINVIRFWRRVEKECNRSVFNRMTRGLVSFSTSKLDGIIASIEKDADEIDKLVPVIEGRLHRLERDNQAEERRLAGLAREEQSAFYEQQLEVAKFQDRERRRDRLKTVRKWLHAPSLPLIESNYRQQEQNLLRLHPGTCTWLKNDKVFQEWLNPDTSTSKIWLRALPGAGKSVLCASTIQDVERRFPASCCLFQYFSFEYFSFDEETVSEIQIYRCLAEQLVNRLWAQLEDIPEDVHVFTQRTTTSVKTEDVRTIIQMLIQRLSTTYIFLDGLDEVCDDGQRWARLSEVLDFLLNLANNHPQVRLWCSSQNRSCVQSKLRDFETIDVTNDSNGQDIERYLSRSIMKLDNLDIDEGTQTLVLKDLCEKAMGCFLWASLMLDSIAKAPTLYAVQELINDSVPSDYEKYYQKKMDSIAHPQRKFVSSLLACIVYAKRPLSLEELCEAIAVLNTADGQNIDKSQRLFKNKVLKLCEPLLQVQETQNERGMFLTCKFCHASVRNFLLKNTLLYTNAVDSTAYSISSETMAEICLRYLSQPCYQRLLTCKGDSFIDCSGEDILGHNLLSYAAKYWDRHFDGLRPSEEKCNRVVDFLKSPQFQTCLQVQSLLVEGQFQPWFHAHRDWVGPQYRRVFPSWLEKHYGPTLENDYRYFVYEWGDILNECTSLHGFCPGELDRCFWNALGPDNFLRSGKSRYKNFAFLSNQLKQAQPVPKRYFEGIDETGNLLVVLILETGENDSSQLQFNCHRWTLNGRSPKLNSSQLLEVKESSWRLYDQPASKPLPGQPNRRPGPVSFTPDLQILRIGSRLFSYSVRGGYSPIDAFNIEQNNYEEIGHRGPYIALSTREPTPKGEIDEPTDLDEHIVIDFSEHLSRIFEESMKSASEAETSTSLQDTGNTRTSQSSISSSRTSLSLLEVEDAEIHPVALTKNGKLQDLDPENIEDDISETDSNSAATSYTEASTAEFSNELEDEDQWNDWGDDVLAIDEQVVDSNRQSRDFSDNSSGVGDPLDAYNSDAEKAIQEDSDGSDELSESNYELSAPMGLRLKRIATPSDNSSSHSIESAYSPSYAASSENSDDEDGNFDNRGGRRLEDLILGSRKTHDPERAGRVTIRVYEIDRGQQQPLFHFSMSLNGGLFASPPTFHPSEPLLVWPIGDQEILFANLEGNTYFTRQLCCSHSQSCHVFIKAHFSSDGKYLHFAALEAQQSDEKLENVNGKKGPLDLHLQVSTHRLSSRKTPRCPPRLIFRTSVPLGSKSKLSVSSLPYTLTWTAQHLYLTTGDRTLSVTKIPLFRASPDAGQPSAPICYSQGKVFLPRMDISRHVYYFPPPTPDDDSTKSHRKNHKPKATVIISSHCSIPSQRHLVPHSLMSPPIGLYLDEEKDLGGWECKANVDAGGKQKINPLGGRLQSKFETFDRNEDCDIVPYLV